jgi:hypothetical protein
MKVRHIQYWRYSDGLPEKYEGIPTVISKITHPNGYRETAPVGWHGEVFIDGLHAEFLQWMTKHCPTADCTPRFNSGNPMVQVHFTDESEAMFFTLSWAK